MKSLQTICLLFIFIARGTSDKCDVCHTFGDNCDGYQSECPSPEDQCGKILLEATTDPISFRSVHRDCFSPSICKLGHFDINVGRGVYVRARMNCCDKGHCENNPLPGLPLSRPNGLYCPSGVGAFTDDCTEFQAKCKGSETKCINLVGYRQRDFVGNITYNIKGCVSSCPLTTLIDEPREVHINGLKKIECSDALKIAHSH